MRRTKKTLYTAVIEQTFAYKKRMKYIAASNSFIEKDTDSLSYVRNVRQPYGWLKESGTPPKPHLDVIVMTDKQCELGDELLVRIIGVFARSDGDHKLVACLRERGISDFSELTDEEKADMLRLYKPYTPEEGWFGVDKAAAIIEEFNKG